MAVGKSSLERASKGLTERNVIDKNIKKEGSFSLIELSAFDKTTKKADESLIGSIKKYGVIVPCIAVKNGETLKVIDGARRIDALKSLGINTVPTVIFESEGEEIKKELSKFKAESATQKVVKTATEKTVDLREEKFKIIGGNGIHTVLPTYLL